MKAVILSGIRKLEVQEVQDPHLKTDMDVLLRNWAVGICGTDVQYFLTGRVGNQAVQYPFVVGHECVAVVEKVGKRVTRVKPGDRVVIDPAVSCGECDQCLNGRSNTCRNLLFLGFPGQLEGCLSEYIVMPQANCYPIEGKGSMVEHILAEPLSIGIYSIRLLHDFSVNVIGILGSGPIGLSVAIAARETENPTIYMTDKINERLKAARKAGAVWVGNPDKSNITREILSREPFQLDAVFECCGDQAALDQAVDLLKPGGRLMIIGIPKTERVTFDAHRMRRKEISIQNVRRQNNCIPAAINLIENGKTDVNFMVTHQFGLEEAQDAFDLVADYKDGVIKAIVRC